MDDPPDNPHEVTFEVLAWAAASLVVVAAVGHAFVSRRSTTTVERVMLAWCERCGIAHLGWFCEGDA